MLIFCFFLCLLISSGNFFKTRHSSLLFQTYLNVPHMFVLARAIFDPMSRNGTDPFLLFRPFLEAFSLCFLHPFMRRNNVLVLNVYNSSICALRASLFFHFPSHSHLRAFRDSPESSQANRHGGGLFFSDLCRIILLPFPPSPRPPRAR